MANSRGRRFGDTAGRPGLSIAVPLILSLLVLATSVLGAFGAFNYAIGSRRALERLQKENTLLADQLSASLVLPIWNFDHDQVLAIMQSIMKDESVYGILVRFADVRSTVQALVRDPQWNVRKLASDFPASAMIEQARSIQLGGDVIGAVEVYLTPRFEKERLRNEFLATISTTGVLDLVLVLCLSLLLWRLVLRPIRAVEAYAVNVSAGGPSAPKGRVRFRGEIARLRGALESMVGLLEGRNRELRESEALYREVFENVSDALFLLDVTPDLHFKPRSFNPAEERATGLSTSSVAGRAMEEFLPKEIAETVSENFRRCVRGGMPISYDEALDLSGGRRYFHTTLVPLRNGEGHIYRVLGVAHDMTERHNAEEALRESERRYRQVFDNASDGLFVVDVTEDGRYRLVEYNPAQEKIIGITNAQAAGRYAEEYLPEGIVEIVNEQNRRCVDAGTPMTFEGMLDLPAGRSYYSTTLVPIRDAKGRIHCLSGLTRDMTESRRMVEALRQSEEKFSQAFHGSPDSITISRLDDGVLLEVNKAFTEVYGYARDEVVGRSSFPGDLSIWVEPADRARLVALVKEHGEASQEWVRFRKRNGTIRYGLVSWRFIEIDGAQRLLSITRDMTERKVMEEALRDSEARFRLIAENSTDMISRHSPEGDFLYVSPACSVLLGYMPENLIGRSPRDLFHPDDLAEVIGARAAVREKKIPVTVSYRVRRADGSYIWFETGSRAICDPETGEVIEIQASSRDITERKRAQEREREHEQQLFQATKLASLGTLVSGIAHEINNPNNFIRLNSQNLEEFWSDIRPVLDRAAGGTEALSIRGIPYAAARDMVESLLRGIGEGSKRIEKLLLNLRDYARGDEGRLNEDVDVNAVVRSAVMIAQNLIHKSTDSFSIRAGDSLPPIRGNYHQLEQVVINLLTNACQALPSRDRKIGIETTTTAAGQVALVVSDEGVGIPKSNLVRVTDPFFTTKRTSGGSGLGLAVSSRIVQNHGGIMTFSSEEGKGTLVTVQIPVGGAST